MIVDRQIEIAKMLLEIGLVSSVFHSVELHQSDKGTFPVYKKGTEEYYVGPDEKRQMFAYIRQTGASQTRTEEKLGSSDKMYWMQVPTRIVVFKDHEERDFDLLTRQFLKPVFKPMISLVSFTNDSNLLAEQESSMGDFSFDATTFYLAIDVLIRMRLTKDDCEVNNCIAYPNPICI
jgi:hypothetical protein